MQELEWLDVGLEYHKTMFPIHLPSIFHGVVVVFIHFDNQSKHYIVTINETEFNFQCKIYIIAIIAINAQ
jgi:hypothetical protein